MFDNCGKHARGRAHTSGFIVGFGGGKCLISVFFLSAVVANAQIYKWVDADGKVHFGDAPPDGVGAEQHEMPQFPTEDEVEQANIELDSMLESRREKNRQTETAEAEPTPPDTFPQNEIFDATTCDSPYFLQAKLSRRSPLVKAYNNGPGRGQLDSTHTRALEKLAGKMRGSWRGEYIELSCSGAPGEEAGILGKGVASVSVRWEQQSGQLTLQSEVSDFPDADRKTMMFYLDLSDYLYFRDREAPQPGQERPKVLADGNRVSLFRVAASDFGFSLSRTHTSRSWAPGYTRQLTRVTGSTGQVNKFRVSSGRLDIVVRHSGKAWRLWHLRR